MRFYILGAFYVLTLLVCSVVTAPSTRRISTHPVFLIVSYDGFRYDYMDKVATPTLHRLKSAGVSIPYMTPVFPTKTFPNHQSIATGMYSESHGIVDNSFFDPLYNKTLSGFSDDPGFWNYDPDVLPIWIRNEMAGEGRTSGCLMWPGSSQPYGANNNSLPTYYHPGYDGTVPWEDRVDTVVSWITNDTNPANLVFLYFDEPDTHGHAFGPNYNETLEEVAKADNRTAYLVEKLTEAGIFDDINLIILSDHGMQDVTPQRIINVTALIDPALIENRYGGTPLFQIIPKEGKEDELYNSLNQNMSLGYTIWKKEELSDQFKYSASRRILDLVLVADPGFAFDDFNPSYYDDKWNLTANETREYGVHGYSNEAASMRPFFIAHGPAFKKAFEFEPIRNIDIVPLLSAVLEIPDVPHNGSLDRVKEMLAPTKLNSILASGSDTGGTARIQTSSTFAIIACSTVTLGLLKSVIYYDTQMG